MSQKFRTDGWVKSATGAAVPGAQIYVCSQPANTVVAPPSPRATIYSDPQGLVPITQPIITDGLGHYDFYAVGGLYTLVVALSGVIQQVYPDQSVGGVGSNSGAGTALILQANGVNLVNQLLLNFKNTAGVTWGDDGAGGVTATISTTSLQTDSVANANQSLLNLKSGSGISLTADGSGGVTVAQTTVSGSAYMIGPNLGFPQTTGGSGNLVTTSNKVRVILFFLTAPITLSKVAIEVVGGSNGTHFSIGIYNSSGTRVVNSGVFTVAGNGIQSATFGATVLTPGFYYYAQTSDNNVGAQLTSLSLGTTSLAALLNTNLTLYGNATNTSASGVLPAALGAVVAENGAAMFAAMAVFT